MLPGEQTTECLTLAEAFNGMGGWVVLGLIEELAEASKIEQMEWMYMFRAMFLA